MKHIDRNGLECIAQKFLKLPNIEKYELKRHTDNRFEVSIKMDDGFEFKIDVYNLQYAYPSKVLQLIREKAGTMQSNVLVAPYISERTAELCKKAGMGYFDYAGNCWFVGHSIYLSECGNANPQPSKSKTLSVFERSSVVSSLILREMFADLNKVWRQKYLSEKVGCSIGQVSKVMDFLIRNAWAEKSSEGYVLTDAESLLKEWCNVYGKKVSPVFHCYTLETPSLIEEKLKKLWNATGIKSYLTGFSGGVRYAPVVRYNKVHVYIEPENIQEAMAYLDIKEVESGSNIEILSLENHAYIADARIIEGSCVVSPVQIYLDTMQLKGRGPELAEAVFRKAIIQ